MGEYAYGRGGGSSASHGSSEPARRTADEAADDAVLGVDRELMRAQHFAAAMVTAAERADRTQWDSARGEHVAALMRARRALGPARAKAATVGGDHATRLAELEQRIDSLKAATAGAAAPEPFTTLASEPALVAAFEAKPSGPVRAGHDQKEAAIRALLASLSPAESRALLARIQRRDPSDALAASCHALAPHRFKRVVEVLQGARERDVRRDAASARRGRLGLPDGLKDELERATGASLDHVRLHTDTHGASVAAAHGARAVAIRSDIFMGAGQYDPASSDGRELIAHEVAHVRQADLGGGEAPAAKRDAHSTAPAEVEADAFAADFRRRGAAASWTPQVAVTGGALRKDLTDDKAPAAPATKPGPKWRVFSDSGLPFKIESAKDPVAIWVLPEWVLAAPDLERHGKAMRAPSRARELLDALGWVDAKHAEYAAPRLIFQFKSTTLADLVVFGAAAFADVGLAPGQASQVTRIAGNKLLVATRLDDPDVAPQAKVAVDDAKRLQLIRALAAATHLSPSEKALANLARNPRLQELEAGNGALLWTIDEEIGNDVFGWEPPVFTTWLNAKTPAKPKDLERPKVLLHDYYQMPIPGTLGPDRELIESGQAMWFELDVKWPNRFPSSYEYDVKAMVTPGHRMPVSLVDCEWTIDTEWEPGKQTKLTTDVSELQHAFTLPPGQAMGKARVTVTATCDAYFEPQTFTTIIEVKSTSMLMAELRGKAGMQGANEQRVDENFNDLTNGSGDDIHGTKSTGDLPKGFTTDPDRGAAERNADREHLKAARMYLASRGKSEKDAVDAIDRELRRLDKAEEALAGDLEKGWKTFQIRGTYLAREDGVPSGPLSLYGSVHLVKLPQFKDGKFVQSEVVVQIRDMSRRFDNEDMAFTGRGESFDAALRDAFVDCAKAYPDGVLSIQAEQIAADPDAIGAGTGKAVGFELGTDTRWKRVKHKLWSPIVNFAVNLAAIAIMAFVPGSPVIVAPLLIVYNNVPIIDHMHEQATRGTLTMGDAALSVAEIVLNVLPLAGAAKPFTGGWFLLEGANWGGQAVIMEASARQAAQQLQAGDVAELGKLYDQLQKLQANGGDPKAIEAKTAEVMATAKHVSERIDEALTEQIKNNGLFAIAGSVIHRAASMTEGQRTQLVDEVVDRRKTEQASREFGLDDTATTVGATPTSPGQQQRSEELGAGSKEITASFVPGASFRGRGVRALTKEQLLANGNRALEAFVKANAKLGAASERAHVDTTAREDERSIAENTHVLQLSDNTRITIRVSVAPLDGETVARSIMNVTKHGVTAVDRGGVVAMEKIEGRFVIQLSDKLDGEHVERAIAHETTELLARRDLEIAGAKPGRDVLHIGSDPSTPLSPHDRGRIAEIKILTETLRAGPSEHAHDELVALVEDMGIRAGVPGADQRFQRIVEEIGTADGEVVAKLRVEESRLSASDAKKLEWTREEAARDRADEAKREHERAPLHEVPTTGLDHIATPAQRAQLAKTASEARTRRSIATSSSIRTKNQAGELPKYTVQIGGNAALAARDPNTLLVDANQRWAVDASSRIAQTADQMQELKAAGLGNPYEFAKPGERVPVEALRFMQDSIAAQGPLVDGRMELSLSDDGKLIGTIHPNDGSGPMQVEVVGVPLVATGFTSENAPGAREKSPRQALIDLDKALAVLSSDPKVGEAAKTARAALGKLHGQVETDSVEALQALSPELRTSLGAMTKAQKALEILGSQEAWANLRANDPSHVLFGDEANKLTDEQIQKMHNVVIAGPGGTGISAAEILLTRSSTVRVTMVGKEAPAGLTENNQFREVVEKHGTPELCAKFHLTPDPAIDGRFAFEDGYMLGAPSRDGGTYDANASPVAANGSATRFAGDTYISAMGRFDDLPPPIAALANQAERAGRKVVIRAQFDNDGHYICYSVAIRTSDGKIIKTHVTGAASRFIDTSQLTDVQRKRVSAAQDHDAPPEGGNFPGGHGPTTTQTARYGRARRANPDSDQFTQGKE